MREHLATSAQVFDYVFVDAHLPDHDGTGLIDQLLALDWPRLPHCVLLARYGSPEAQREGDHPGVSALLTKPLHARALGDCLTQLQAGLQADGGEGSTLPADRTELQRLRGARVLLVEDNDLNQEVACELLRELGLEVDVAENGEQAVHQVAQQPYDLVLMDMQMPVMDGLEATRRIRASGQHDALPIIAMTANVLESDRQRCLEAGMNAHLAKPIDPEELWPLLLQWIRQSAAPAAPAVVSQARPASRPDGELPPLPVQGLDVDAGLHHAMGRPALYLSLLRRFADAQEAVLSAAHQALASGELPVLVRLAHTIKGSAGTIGARTIQQAANLLERSAAAGEPRETLAERLHALELPLRQMANELHAVLPPVEPSRTSAPRPDPQRLQGICDQLESMLDGGNAHAADTLDEHAAQLRQAFPAHFARIERAVRSFDFELALETLRAARSASP